MGGIRTTSTVVIPGAIIIAAAVTLYTQNHKAPPTSIPPQPTPVTISSETPVAHQPTSSPIAAPSQNFSDLKSFMRLDSRTFDFIDRKWKLVDNLIALPANGDARNKKDFLISQQGLDLFKSENSLNDSRGKPVVFFPERNRIGYISGTLTIRLADRNLKDRITRQYGLKVEHFFEDISTLIILTGTFDELIKLRSQLSKDENIKTIEVEIVENNLERQ